jgi:hypothetical protein
MRRCVRCDQDKDESEFNWRNIEKGYLQSVCRPCQAQDSRDRDRENIRMSNKSSRERGTERAQQFVIDYLSNRPCQVCGETDVSVLTFHHLNPEEKSYNVSDMIAHGYSINTIQTELEKCAVVCYNDHMRIEQEAKGRGKKFWQF